MIIALGVPILDTGFAILRRATRGVPIFKADAEHIHHRLIQLGYTRSQALIILYVTSAVLSLVGITILMSRGMTAVIAGAALVIIALLAARFLGYVKSWRSMRKQVREALHNRRELQFAQSYGRVLELESMRMEKVEEFQKLLLHTMERLGLNPQPAKPEEALKCAVGSELVWRLSTLTPDADQKLALRAADELAPAVLLALERWQTIPGLTLISVHPAADVASVSASLPPSSHHAKT
jgi:UDP-GlcNAc:undecaprenyl-phosphate GlcNAc-1-phosphate transferase